MTVAGRIRVLAPETVALIAAGEVVERPASVVKELVENALDAGARRVEVILSRGAEVVTVVDDGCGMTREEMRLAVERHATSKIASADDLLRLRTLGFRGEALPSIAAVSRLELISRPPGGETGGGWRLVLRGGAVEEEGPAPSPPGTRVRVSELFHNTPARRKHLRTPAWEVERCVAAVASLVLAFPDVAFLVRHDGHELLATAGGDLRTAAAAVLGRETAARLLPVAAGDGRWAVEGLVAPPDLARATRRHLHFIVNRRPAGAPVLSRAVEQAFRGLLPVGRYPVGVLSLEVPPEEVDANVHPAKAVVRFQDEERAFRLVLRAVRAALERASLVAPGRAPGVTAHPEGPGAGGWTAGRAAPAWAGEARTPYGWATAPPVRSGAAAAGEPSSPGFGGDEAARRWPALRLLGQVAGTYLVAEGEDGLYLVDQHAAHERVRYEELRRRLAGGPVPTQFLAVPLPVAVGPAAVAGWRRSRPALERLGFLAEEFGPDALLLRAAPAWVGQPDQAFLAAIDRLEEAGAAEETDDAVLARLAFAACRSSVRSGDRLSDREAEELLAELGRARDPFTCPHGRPTVVRLSHGDLERLFLRA